MILALLAGVGLGILIALLAAYFCEKEDRRKQHNNAARKKEIDDAIQFRIGRWSYVYLNKLEERITKLEKKK